MRISGVRARRSIAEFATTRLLLDISPVAAYQKAQPGVASQGRGTRRRLRRFTLDGRPRLCYPLRGGGGISSRAAPLSMIGKGRGEKVDPTIIRNGGFRT